MSPRLAPLLIAIGLTLALPARGFAGGDEAAAMGALKLAKHYYDKGDFKKAAERFHEAYGIYSNPAFLFNAARAEQRGFMLDEAERDFKKVLQRSKEKETRHRARVHLEEIAAYRKQLQANGTDAAKAKAAADTARRDAERAREEARRAKEEAKRAKQEAALAEKAAHGKGARRVVAGVAGMSLKEKILYGCSAGLLVVSAVIYGAAISERGDAVDLERTIQTTEDRRLRETRIAQHEDKVASSAGARNGSLISLGLGVGLAWYTYAYGAPAPADRTPAKKASWRLAPWANGHGLALAGRF